MIGINKSQKGAGGAAKCSARWFPLLPRVDCAAARAGGQGGGPRPLGRHRKREGEPVERESGVIGAETRARSNTNPYDTKASAVGRT